MPPHEVEGLHEVQVGELEMRNDDDAVDVFNRVYERWHLGDLDVALPGGETGTQVLDRYLPALTDLRMRYLDDDDWTATSWWSATVRRSGWPRRRSQASTGRSWSSTTSATPNRWCWRRSPTAAGVACTGASTARPSCRTRKGMPRPEELESADPMG